MADPLLKIIDLHAEIAESGQEILRGVKNPVDPKAYFATVFIWDPKFAGELSARFDQAVVDGFEPFGLLRGVTGPCAQFLSPW